MKLKELFRLWANRVDDLLIFDPSRWPHREAISRAIAVVVVGTFIGVRVYRFDLFPQFFQEAHQFYGAIRTAAGTPVYGNFEIGLLWGVKLLVWIIETAIFLGYLASYASRARAVGIARGFMEVGFPFLVAGLPVIMSLMPYSLPRWLPFSSGHHLLFFLAIMGLIVVGGVINLVGLLTMRRAFTIMSEARSLVTRGIFRYVRHPLYSGHFIMFLGSLFLRLHAVTLMLYLLFVGLQVVRARIEERKLSTAFAEYTAYRRDTGMFWPRRPRTRHAGNPAGGTGPPSE